MSNINVDKHENIFQKMYRVFLVERRLPISIEHRYQKLLYANRLQKILREISDGPPIACAKNADAELHMLTCERDLYMAIAACKSFLKFFPDISVVFHGDESLDESMSDLLQSAIPSSRFISYQGAEDIIKSSIDVFQLRQKVAGRFELPPGYEKQRRAWALKVFDFHILSDAKKVIVMDSDTLFVKRPDELIDWIEPEKSTAFYSIPQFPNLKVDPKNFSSIFPNGTPVNSFNGGLYGYNKEDVGSEFLMDVVRKLISEKDYPILGDECFWRAVYSLIPSEPLSFDVYPLITPYYQKNNLMPDLNKAKYIHFICKHRGGLYGKIAKEVFR
ncbi:hypothetical protein [Marinobacter sp. DY40_1A1]|uniref:hypothetical protein n=1 Tax=Marinobacter sp. DY40_1A1 TaxID=2583229 RepID=UPI0019059F55|nr:hypothetical protein [Marinobacter sp. DY40_1A1]MBK1885938.1 hypothetical protein [Marinobacter sp. DY40_1A1]|tara:strand:- start:1725 stop:2717 length:993 start_codon:yes stop_codon:yes gene_type:complete